MTGVNRDDNEFAWGLFDQNTNAGTISFIDDAEYKYMALRKAANADHPANSVVISQLNFGTANPIYAPLPPLAAWPYTSDPTGTATELLGERAGDCNINTLATWDSLCSPGKTWLSPLRTQGLYDPDRRVWNPDGTIRSGRLYDYGDRDANGGTTCKLHGDLTRIICTTDLLYGNSGNEGNYNGEIGDMEWLKGFMNGVPRPDGGNTGGNYGIWLR
jgi:hypothetical protein